MQHSSRLGTYQEVTLSQTTASSSPFGSQTSQIRVSVADVTGTPTSIRLRIGDGTPTALATDAAIPANWVEYFTVTPGQRVAAILVAGTAPTAKLSVAEIV